MRTFILRWAVIVIAVYLVAWGLPQLGIFGGDPLINYNNDWVTLAIFSGVLALLNTFVKPILPDYGPLSDRDQHSLIWPGSVVGTQLFGCGVLGGCGRGDRDQPSRSGGQCTYRREDFLTSSKFKVQSSKLIELETVNIEPLL